MRVIWWLKKKKKKIKEVVCLKDKEIKNIFKKVNGLRREKIKNNVIIV